MIKTCISKNWKFTEIPMNNGYQDVDLPHDYSVLKERDENGDPNNGYFRLGCGKYAKFLTFEENKHYILHVDGAYSISETSLNENVLKIHPHGYTPYLVDLTDSIVYGINNKLVITTNPLEHSTRWYSGAGLYRDVFLYEGGAVRIEPWDMFVSTAQVKDDTAEIKLSYTVSSDEDVTAKIAFTVSEKNGNDVLTDTIEVDLKKGKNELETRLTLLNPKIWDVDTPNLYTLKTEIFTNNVLTDTTVENFGIKTIEVSAENGLVVNGKSIKLRGGCIHHDHGALGAKAYAESERRKIRLLKEAGFNAVRIAHNPPSLALLNACDELGMFLMDEAFDVWRKRKFVTHDYHIFFTDKWREDLALMVRRDRNHACVLSYSIGNEIYEIDCTSGGAELSKEMVAEVKKYDDTKLVTAAIQKISLAEYRSEDIDTADYKEYMASRTGNGDVDKIIEITKPIEAPLDIIGCNYYHSKYEQFHKANPDKVIWGSENWNIGSTSNIYDYWNNVINNSYNIGDFTWTAIDNLGEVGMGISYWEDEVSKVHPIKYPWKSCFQGDLDLCGMRRPQSYYREAVWFDDTPIRLFVTHPKNYGKQHYGTRWHWHDVEETWTFGDEYEGKPFVAEAYTKADLVKWYINDKLVAETKPVKAIATLDTAVYEKGTITAVAIKDGKEQSRATLYTCSKPSKLLLNVENNGYTWEDRRLIYVDITVTDSDGNIIRDYDETLSAEVVGGSLEAIFCARPCCDDDYTASTCHTFRGQALAVIKTTVGSDVTLKITSGELENTVNIIAE